jgi:TetR/AcrR family fatty acid metabolism transcriptional regulator
MSKPELALERKNQIIAATIECISRYGYNNFSMQDVARIADVSKGIIHYYFLNKEDLMMAVLERVAGDIEGLLADFMSRTSDPSERLRYLVQTVFLVVRDKREYYCINMDFWTQINQKEKVREAIANHYAKFRAAAAGILQNGMDVGQFRQCDPALLASVIIAIVDGVSLQWLFDAEAFQWDETVKACEEHVLRLVLK